MTQLKPGYIWMALNCLSSAGYVLYMRKRIRHFNFKDFDTVYYNNILSLPVMLAFSLCLESWSSDELSRTLYVFRVLRRLDDFTYDVTYSVHVMFDTT
jgi:GDP-mannose transporter